jgi:hypothetical protein
MPDWAFKIALIVLQQTEHCKMYFPLVGSEISPQTLYPRYKHRQRTIAFVSWDMILEELVEFLMLKETRCKVLPNSIVGS